MSRHPIVETLAARPPWEPARLASFMARFSGAVRDVCERIDPVERLWHDITAASLDAAIDGDQPPLWVVLGDSTAQGIGASSFDHGWVPRLHSALDDTGRPHAVVNLSRSGALSSYVIEEQLPLLDQLPYEPALVTVCVGANDLMRNPHAPALVRRLETLGEHLPEGAVMATLPTPSFSPTGVYVNRAIRRIAEDNGHNVAELSARILPPHRGLSADRYHPNDAGYGAWVGAFAEPLGLDADLVPLRGDLTTRRSAPEAPGTTTSG